MQVGNARMEQDQRVALARHFIVEFRAVHIGVACGHVVSVSHGCSAPLRYQRPALHRPPRTLVLFYRETACHANVVSILPNYVSGLLADICATSRRISRKRRSSGEPTRTTR